MKKYFLIFFYNNSEINQLNTILRNNNLILHENKNQQN